MNNLHTMLTLQLESQADDLYQQLDYLNSDDAAEIDMGIRNSIMRVRLSILAMGLGLAKIKSNRLFKKLGFRSMLGYVNGLSNDTKTRRSGIYNWLKIGEIYIKYKDELQQIGFSESDGPSKLPFLEQALAVKEKGEVFDNIKNMSVRDFIKYAKGVKVEHSNEKQDVYIKGHVVYVKGKRAIIVNKNIGVKISKYYMEIINLASEALKTGGRIIPVHVRNKKEDERFRQVYSRIMAEIRKK